MANINPLLLAALSARSGGEMEPGVQALLAGMQGGSGGTLAATQEMLMSQLEAANPTAAAVAKYLAARREPDDEDDEEDGSGETAFGEDEVGAIRAELEAVAEEQRQAVEQSGRLARIIELLERKVAELSAEAAWLRERNDALAAALGACYLCWGEDPACPNCRGAGRPGSVTPDRSLFLQFVWPTVRALKERADQQARASSLEMSVTKGVQDEQQRSL